MRWPLAKFASVTVLAACLGSICMPASALASLRLGLQPADEAKAKAAYRVARTGRPGVRYDFSRLQLVVKSIEASTKDAGLPRFSITVRAENRSTRALTNLEGVIACQ